MNEQEAERQRAFLMTQGFDMRPNSLDAIELPRLSYSRHGRDCFPAAAATAFGLSIDDMPDTGDADPAWIDVYARHLFANGLLVVCVETPPFYVSCLEIPDREHGHAIVARDGRRVFDPVPHVSPEKARARAAWPEQGRVYAFKTPKAVEDVVRIAYALANRLEPFDPAVANRALASLDRITGKK